MPAALSVQKGIVLHLMAHRHAICVQLANLQTQQHLFVLIAQLEVPH
jgi:hypothetical protein